MKCLTAQIPCSKDIICRAAVIRQPLKTWGCHNVTALHFFSYIINAARRVPTNYSLYFLNFNAFNKRFGNGFCGSRPLSFRANHFVNGILYASVNSISVPPMSSM